MNISNSPSVLSDFFSNKMIITLKENLWVLWLWGILYQLVFLIFYDSLVLFSWTQIPADSVFLLLSLLVTYLMAWPWLHDDFGEKDNQKFFLKKEIFYFGILYFALFLVLSSEFFNLHWLLWGLFVQLNLSILFYIFVYIKRKMRKNFSEKTKSIILVMLVLINTIMFWTNMYSNYEYFDKTNSENLMIWYMNDKYIITEKGVLKNDSGMALKRVQISME